MEYSKNESSLPSAFHPSYTPVHTMEPSCDSSSAAECGWTEPRSASSSPAAAISPGAMKGSVEFAKWTFLVIFVVLAGLSNWAVLSYTHDRTPSEPLPDILFLLMDEQEWASRLGDYMVTSCLICLFSMMFFHKSRLVIARRIFFIVATLYTMRSLTLLVTQLPPGYQNNTARCRERVNLTADVFFSRLGEQTIRLGFQEKNSMLCGDLLFSGHTLLMMSCALAVAYYLPIRWRLLQWIPNICACVGAFSMIISRTHYTIDIIVAYWLSNFVFRMYHAYCEVDVYMERKKSVLHGWWPCRIVAWLEEDIVPGKIHNKWSIPFGDCLRSTFSGRSSGHHKQISISSSSTFQMP